LSALGREMVALTLTSSVIYLPWELAGLVARKKERKVAMLVKVGGWKKVV
jgi:TATA-box binding protein (TBP) (component of TFIID and TFIIIB)